jgi:hypothetical protein
VHKRHVVRGIDAIPRLLQQVYLIKFLSGFKVALFVIVPLQARTNFEPSDLINRRASQRLM